MSSTQQQILEEPLLRENPNRYVMLPICYPDMWEMYQTHRKAFWNEAEIEIAGDLKDWKSLKKDEQHFIKYVLAFFAASDGIVLENLARRFCDDIQIPEARAFYSFQMAMETIHGITYSQLLDVYISDSDEKHKLFRAIETVPSVKEKAVWAQKWIDSTDSFATRLVAFACVEGIFFSGSFCCIYWIKERGILSGLCKSNDFISRDERLHVDFAVLLYYKYVVNKLSTEKVHEMVKEAVAIEESFITESIPCRLLGMNADMMKEYIRYVANRLVKQLGHSALYPNATQPFPFMDRICFDTKGNFFEERITNYQLTIEKEAGNDINDLEFDADF